MATRRESSGDDGHFTQNIFIAFGVFFLVLAVGFFIKEFALHDGIKATILFLLSITTFIIAEYLRSRDT